MILKNEILLGQISYLSVEEGIDYLAFKKAHLFYAKKVYFLTKITIEETSCTKASSLIQLTKSAMIYLDKKNKKKFIENKPPSFVEFYV